MKLFTYLNDYAWLLIVLIDLAYYLWRVRYTKRCNLHFTKYERELIKISLELYSDLIVKNHQDITTSVETHIIADIIKDIDTLNDKIHV